MDYNPSIFRTTLRWLYLRLEIGFAMAALARARKMDPMAIYQNRSSAFRLLRCG
jgi:hypothetical protein